MQIPSSFIGWSVFTTGLLIVAYRIHGIDGPRAWIEWIERQFTYSTNLRIIGAVFLLVAITLGFFGGLQAGIIGNLFVFCVTILGLVGLSLLVLQNHARHVIFATAESSDLKIRISSVIIVLIGMGLMIAPFYFT